jgi:hypothetical protein
VTGRKPKPEDKKYRKIGISLPPGLTEALLEFAEEEELSVSGAIAVVLRDRFKKENPSAAA